MITSITPELKEMIHRAQPKLLLDLQAMAKRDGDRELSETIQAEFGRRNASVKQPFPRGRWEPLQENERRAA